MSQKKVDEYKAGKANRKELVKKEKRKRMRANIIGSLFLILMGGWIGYSVYDSYMDSRPRQVAEVDYAPMNQYMQEMSSTEESITE